MKRDFTYITLVLDRSGSMANIAVATRNGVNRFLEKHKELPGDCYVTLIQFSDCYEEHFCGPISKNTDLAYRPCGSTALLDALGRSITDTGKRLSSMAESERPDKVLFVVVTDGYENASQEFTFEKIDAMIRHQREVYGWEFIFLGANQDAIATASRIGIDTRNAMTYMANDIGTRCAYATVTGSTMRYRSKGNPASLNFTDEDRKQQSKASA